MGMTIKDLGKVLHQNGGFTVKVVTDAHGKVAFVPADLSNFVASIYGREERTRKTQAWFATVRGSLSAVLASYVRRHRADLVDRDGLFFGAWVEPDGRITLDVSRTFSTRAHVEAHCLEHQQRAYYDAQAGACVDVKAVR
jgi:hypothetical protein